MIERLSFENLSFSFDSSPLLEEITMVLPAGENVWITGPTGTGKSAILKLLCGLLMPTSGSFQINDAPVNEMTFEEFLPFRMKIGYSFDYGGLLANRSIRDNLLLPLQYHGTLNQTQIEDRVDTLLSRFKLTQHNDRRPAAVSGSVRKTAVLARSLINHPEVLLLDDPFTGLDRDGVVALLELVEEHRKNHGLKHVYFSSRGESVSNRLATCTLNIENRDLVLSTAGAIGKAA